MKLRVLSQQDVAKALNMDLVLDTVESVYKYKAEDKTVLWPTVFHDFNPGHQDMDIKSGYIKGMEIHGLKTINWTEKNPELGLPALVGLILVFDTATGLPLGLLDAGNITGMRTGSAAAIGAKYLARKDSDTMLMVGAGHQALFQIGAFLKQFPNMKTVYVADLPSPEHGVEYVKTVKDKLLTSLNIDASNVNFHAVCGEAELADTVGKVDLVVTATPSRTPIIKKEWVKPGTHFSCVGADMSGKVELDPQLFADALIYCDDLSNCMEVGEMETALKSGVISENQIMGEIGNLILGKSAGRTSDDQITIYDTTGLALHDLANAKTALDYAEKEGLGQIVEL